MDFTTVCMGALLPLVAVVQHIARVDRLTHDDLSGRPVRNLAVVTGILLSLLGLSAIIILVVLISL